MGPLSGTTDRDDRRGAACRQPERGSGVLAMIIANYLLCSDDRHGNQRRGWDILRVAGTASVQIDFLDEGFRGPEAALLDTYPSAVRGGRYAVTPAVYRAAVQLAEARDVLDRISRAGHPVALPSTPALRLLDDLGWVRHPPTGGRDDRWMLTERACIDVYGLGEL